MYYCTLMTTNNYTYIHFTSIHIISHTRIENHSSVIIYIISKNPNTQKLIIVTTTHKVGCSHICSCGHVLVPQKY